MGFHSEVRLNDITQVNFGTRGAPNFSVSLIENDAGQEEAVARWEAPKREYEAAFGKRKQVNIYSLLEFYITKQGVHSFPFKDWSDYATTSNGTVHLPDANGNTPTVDAEDFVIGTGDGLTKTFQLVKKYTSGSVVRSRNLKLPVQGTVRVAVDGVAQTESTHYSVNYETGVITFVTAPGSSLDVTAGCEFNVEVRFDPDTNLDITIDGFATSSTQVFLTEVRDQRPNPEEAFHGGSTNHGAVSTDTSITLAGGRVQVFNPSVGGLAIVLPPEEDVEPGGPLFYLVNDGGEDMDLQRDDNSSVVTIPAGLIAQVWLSEDALGNRTWLASRS